VIRPLWLVCDCLQRYQSIDAGGAGGAELLLECRKQDLRKVITL
jgi:hypothetical protein